MKKETLREAAERQGAGIHSFTLGAEWQAERMYSEEQLRQAFHVGRLYQGREADTTFNEWFEQFKKK